MCFMIISLQWGDTALIKAAEKGHASTVKILVEHGAAVDVQDEVAILYAPHTYRRIGLSGACAYWDNSKIICAT